MKLIPSDPLSCLLSLPTTCTSYVCWPLGFFSPLIRNSYSSSIRVELKVSRRLVAKAPSPWHAECVKRSAQKKQRNFYDAEGYMIKSNLVLSYNFFFLLLLFARSIIMQHEAVEITTPQVYTQRETMHGLGKKLLPASLFMLDGGRNMFKIGILFQHIRRDAK